MCPSELFFNILKYIIILLTPRSRTDYYKYAQRTLAKYPWSARYFIIRLPGGDFISHIPPSPDGKSFFNDFLINYLYLICTVKHRNAYTRNVFHA